MVKGLLIKSFGFASLILLSVSFSHAETQRVVLPDSILNYAYQQVSPLDVGSYDDFVRQFITMAENDVNTSDKQWLLKQLRQPSDIAIQRKFHTILTQYAEEQGISPSNWDLPFFDKGFLERMLNAEDNPDYREGLAKQFAGSENIVVASMRSEMQQRFIYITLKDVSDMMEKQDLNTVFESIESWLQNVSIENQIVRNQSLSHAQLLAVRHLLERSSGAHSVAAK